MNSVEKVLKNLKFTNMTPGCDGEPQDLVYTSLSTLVGRGALAKFKKEIRQAIQEVYGWHPVENGLPKENVEVLWMDDSGNRMIASPDNLLRDVAGHLRIYGDSPSFVPTKWKSID